MKKNVIIIILGVLVFSNSAILWAEQGYHGGWAFNLKDFLFTWKYATMVIFTVVGMIALYFRKLTFLPRLLMMGAGFILFSFVFELHPSPLCAIEKPFLFGMRNPFLAFIIVGIVLSVITTKGFCGTACPAGGFQELFYSIPVFKKIKRRRVPFKVTNIIRFLLFLTFLVMAFGWKQSPYPHINLFEFFHLRLPSEPGALYIFLIPLIIYIITSMLSYRPFCAYICPVGLWSWLLEQLSLTRINMDVAACNKCKVCEKLSPCTAIYDIVQQKSTRAECFLCQKCIDVCPENALSFGLRKK